MQTRTVRDTHPLLRHELIISAALQVGIFFYDGKKAGGDLSQAFNQNKMNLCSSVHHLASMGLYDVTVFGLVADGFIGYATCAWGTKVEDDSSIAVSALFLFLQCLPYNCFRARTSWLRFAIQTAQSSIFELNTTR